MGAKEELRKVMELNKAVEAAMAQLETIQADIERITPVYNAAPVQGGSNDRANAIVRLMTAREKCNSIIDAYADHKAAVLESINRLSDGEYIQVLTLHYIKGLSWEECADKMHYSLRKVQQIHGEALIDYEKAIKT